MCQPGGIGCPSPGAASGQIVFSADEAEKLKALNDEIAKVQKVMAATTPELEAAQAKWEEAVKKIVGDGKPIDGRVNFELPEIAENGNTVPFTVSVDSPMTEQDYVKAARARGVRRAFLITLLLQLSSDSGMDSQTGVPGRCPPG